MDFNPFLNPTKPPRPKQQDCFAAIDHQDSLLANLWTGYGKTWVALYLAQHAINHGRQFLITCPLKALVDQLTAECDPYFPTLPVSGDYRQNKALLFEPDFKGFCMTYEMAYTKLINQSQRRILFEGIGAFIIDEIQILSDPGRGAVVESMILLIQHFYPRTQLLLMSATLGNAESFANHFGLELVKTEEGERPVPLETEIRELLLGKSRDQQFGTIFHALCQLIGEYPLSDQMPTMLVFCESRWLSKRLNTEISKKYPHIKCDYHNAGRSKKDRSQIEADFRAGNKNFIFCTPTLAMGINVPCDICVLTAVSRWNSLLNKKQMLGANEIIQKIGRAGRPGMQSNLYRTVQGKNQQYGKAIIFCAPNERARIEDIIDHPLNLTTQIPKNLKYILLTWVCAGITSIDGLREIFGRVFMEEHNWQEFQDTITWLKEKFFLREDEAGRLSLSHAGEIVAYFAIQPETVLHLLRMRTLLDAEKDLSLANVFVVLLATPEFTENIRSDSEMDRAAMVNTNHFIHRVLLYEVFGKDKFHVVQLEAVKKAFALVYNDYLSARYSLDRTKSLQSLRIEPGDLIVLQNTLRRILAAAQALLGKKWRYGKALDIISTGADNTPMLYDSDVIELARIDGIGMKTAILLVEANINTVKDLKEINPHHFANRLKRHVVQRNEALKNYAHQMGIRYQAWRAPGEKILTRILGAISKPSTQSNLRTNKGKIKDKSQNPSQNHVSVVEMLQLGDQHRNK